MGIHDGTYHDLRGSLRTGDIYLCGGMAGVSLALEMAQLSRWSHCGIVIKTSELVAAGAPVPAGVPEYLLWESTFMLSKEEQDHESAVDHYERAYGKGGDKSLNGPMLVSLDERMEQDTGMKLHARYAFRHLHVDRTDEMLDGIGAFIRQVSLAAPRYPDVGGVRNLWDDVVDFWRGRHDDDVPHDVPGERWSPGDETGLMATYECAELAAQSLMRLGVLTNRHPPSAYEPKDWSERGRVLLRRRAFLGPERWFNAD